jgi:uncharacterized protein
MGLLRGGINEVIATTAFNAAPVGIHYREGKYHAVLFLGSHTAENVARDGWLVANIVHDPVLYVKTAFKDLPPEQFIGEPVNGKTMHRLAGADGWAAFTATVEHRTAEALTVSLMPEKEVIEEVSLYPVNRGFNSLIDATVHATRYAVTRDAELKKHIGYHAGIVRKCGGRRELEALEMLGEYIR